ncbi:N2227-domain-containing protein [Decorospora gaudefroyi]|uniref:N2227-domain-containing protein n=1 Tax=Decorospora gaudefroyi TaxID=184978 RepID=A0A6A5K495_9PLEO|nr:N2227-domain-containing protein [Decorospora gaudefroyi]
MRLSILVILTVVSSRAFAGTDPSNKIKEASVQSSDGIAEIEQAKFAIENAEIAQDALQMGVMPSRNGYDSPRHHQEKAHLMKRFDRKSGMWGSSHPRYRLLEALWGYSSYRERHVAELDRWRSLYKNMGKKQKQMVQKVVGYKKRLDDIEELIYKNDAVCKSLVMRAMEFYGIEQKELDEHLKQSTKEKRQADKFAVSQSLKHYVRDWADEGIKERNEAFPCILSILETLKAGSTKRTPLKVLLPGSGLGRLGHEVANLGDFEVTINEWSMFMNVGYRYIESQTSANTTTIHPFIDAMSHHALRTDMMRSVTTPNITPNPSVLLVEGDFNTAFKDRHGHYDIIVTHFFIDTARNLMEYFDTISRLLKPGGRWVNFGPLLYGTGPFVQLTLDEIINVIEEMGFVFEDIGDECGTLTFEGKKVRSKEAEYGFNVRALTRYAYLAQAWMVRKV